MPDGKIRHPNHITDTRALKFLSSLFPDEWVQREINPDYGIDIDLELFDYEDGRCITLGEHVFLQVKGTQSAQFGKIELFGSNSQKSIDVLKFDIDVAELLLVERMGSAIPVLLVVVDLEKEVAYQICLNDYINKVLPLQNSRYKSQDTVRIFIPISNILEKNNLDILYWYGKRAKLYAMLHEMSADADNFNYVQNFEYPEKGKAFIIKYKNYDAWNAKKFWRALEYVYELFEELDQNDLICDESKRFILSAVENKDQWETELVREDLWGNDPIPAYLETQKQGMDLLFEKLRWISGLFEDTARNSFMPTHMNFALFEEY